MEFVSLFLVHEQSCCQNNSRFVRMVLSVIEVDETKQMVLLVADPEKGTHSSSSVSEVNCETPVHHNSCSWPPKTNPTTKSVKKGSYPLHLGVQGFFITCDCGRERQASHEAINVLDTFYEQLVDDEESDVKHAAMPNKPLNKKIKFSDSDSSSDDEESEEDPNHQNQTNEADESSAKKQCLETVLPKCEGVVNDEPKNKSIDELIEDELRELKDRSKRRFVGLDSGCNGVVFVQMIKRDGDPGPA
ncbi:Thump domain-containing protein [Thalictrum thalictroides]|uniref:Thump domain-containing protein n=1 Tax=Thalictrum thalictroides TaxID=46969 RepID=A0A7J6WXJ2_THATH|nr:Thump domain-containing protein [Thalictrum thalictroides]